MKEKKVLNKTISLKCYNLEDVSKEYQDLYEAAKISADKAYAEYSKFRVGASVLLEDGTILSANNQENVAYPSGLCAERTVLFYTHAQYPDKQIKAIAIYSPDAQNLLTPCGACRQVMIEYEHLQKQNITTIIFQNNEVFILDAVKDWLPFEFNEPLKK